MAAPLQRCRACGYWSDHSSGRSRHRKECKQLQILELQEENRRLREQHAEMLAGAEQRDAAIQALEARMHEQYAQLAAKVERLEEQQRAIVSAQQTTIQNQTVNNNTININIYPYEKTPLPPRSTVSFSNPPAVIPTYFGQKHLGAPKTRNLKVVDGKMSVYTKDRASGIVKWVERDKRATLASIVSDILEDLYEEYASPKNAAWQGWRQWAVAEGLRGFSEPETMEAFKTAVDQIECKLVAGCPDV